MIELLSLDVAGGDVVSRSPDLAGRGLVEQLAEIESRLDVLDKHLSIAGGPTLTPVRQVPWAAVREALLNPIVHRDWLPLDPVRLTWIAACTVAGRPAARPGSTGVWLPGSGVVERATHDAADLAAARRRGLVTWWRPDAAGGQALVLTYLHAVGRISSGDVADITGLTQAGGRLLLGRLETAGLVQRGGTTTRGRNAHYVAAPPLSR